MYLLSGTLFFIASFFMFITNHLFSNQSDPVLLLFAVISLFGGIVLYYIHFSEPKKQDTP